MAGKEGGLPAIDGGDCALRAARGSLLDQIVGLERQLTERPLESIRGVSSGTDRGAGILDDLSSGVLRHNAEVDPIHVHTGEEGRADVEAPETILDPGGAILFADPVVGTCALLKIEDGVFELSKMESSSAWPWRR